MVLTDPLDLHADDRLELAFLQRDSLWRYRRCETRVEADFPTLMGKGGHDRGEFRILEVGEAPCEHTIAEAPFRLGPLVEHEKRGPDSRAAFDVPNRVKAPVGTTALPTGLGGATEPFRPTDVGYVLEGLAAAVDVVSQADRERRISGPRGSRVEINTHVAKAHCEFMREAINPWRVFLLRDGNWIARRGREPEEACSHGEPGIESEHERSVLDSARRQGATI